MKRMIAPLLLCMSVALLLAGCKTMHDHVKPVSSAAGTAADCADRCRS